MSSPPPPPPVVLLLDLDGVLADVDAAVAQRAPADWALCGEALWERAGREAQVYRFAKAAFLCDAFFRDVPLVDGARDAVRELLAWNDVPALAEIARLEVFFCSSPKAGNATCHSDKAAWVAEHWGAAAAKRLILARDKTLVYGSLLVDDRASFSGVLAHAPAWQHVLFRRPYNEHALAAHPCVLHAWHDWRAVLVPRIAAARCALRGTPAPTWQPPTARDGGGGDDDGDAAAL